MLAITKKTKRIDLEIEIATHRQQISLLEESNIRLRMRAENAERTAGILETDVANLLGTVRVMSDSSREVRIRRSSVRDADMAYALPQRNTDKI